MKIFPSCHPCLLSRARIGISQQVQGPVNQEPPRFFREAHMILPRLTPGSVEIDIEFRLRTGFITAPEWKCNNIRLDKQQ